MDLPHVGDKMARVGDKMARAGDEDGDGDG